MKTQIIFCLFLGLAFASTFDQVNAVNICMLPVQDVLVNGTTAKAGNIICDKAFIATVWEIYKGASHQVAKAQVDERMARGEFDEFDETSEMEATDGFFSRFFHWFSTSTDKTDSTRSTERIQRNYLGGGYYTSTKTNLKSEVYNILPLETDSNGELTAVEIHIPITAGTSTEPSTKCFHGDVVVRVLVGDETTTSVVEMKMSSLVVGHMIETSTGFSRVDGWLDRDPHVQTPFIKIEAEGSSITLTTEHYIMVLPKCDILCGPIPLYAEDAKLDDCLVKANGGFAKITNISKIVKIGVYAPYIKDMTFKARDFISDSNVFFEVTPYAIIFPNSFERAALYGLMKGYEYAGNDPNAVDGMNLYVRSFFKLYRMIY